ncbi:MAG: DUF11 domain-containing protein [Burkholderiaceae bacterium]|jgi:uncharacterized repeat protein (TIGR01451 family)/fimbrial isopeptide formation D2 family protein|nr:DUF11 domain-containing protein [Burkholderiaceae bacterium]
MKNAGQQPPPLSSAGSSRWKLAAFLAAGLAPLWAQAATNYDVLVNQDVFLEQTGTGGNAVDNGPAGGQFILRAKVKINGPSGTLNNVELTEKLPVGAIFQGIATPGISCPAMPQPGTVIDASNASIVCILPTVEANVGEVFTHVDFRVLLPSESTGWKFTASTADVVGNKDPESRNNSGIERGITTYKRADLAVSIAGPTNGATVIQGSVVNYKVVTSNADSPYAFPLKAGEKAVVRFAQPAGTVFQGTPSAASGWICAPGSDTSTSPATPYQECTYTVPSGESIAPGEDLPSLTFPVTVQVASGQVPAQVSVKGQDTNSKEFAESVWENNTTSTSITIQPNQELDMALIKTVDKQTLDMDALTNVPLEYTLKIARNSGLLNPESVTVTDTLPPGVTVPVVGSDWYVGTGWTCTAEAATATGQKISCSYEGDLTLGNKKNPAYLQNLLIRATVDRTTLNGAKEGATLVNRAVLDVPNESGASSRENNQSEATSTITDTLDLSIEKVASVGVVAAGQDFYYDITVTNNGPLDVLVGQTITITDTLDRRLEFMGAPAPWTCTPAAAGARADSEPKVLITCTLDSGLVNRQTSTLRLNVRPHLNSGEFAHIENEATLNDVGNRTQASILSNKSEVNISGLVADLSLTKSATRTLAADHMPQYPHGNYTSGSEVVYTLTVKNHEVVGQPTQMAKTVVVTDTVENLINTARANALGAEIVPLYANNRYLTAEVRMPDGSAATSNGCTLNNGNEDTRSLVTCKLLNVPVSDELEYTIVIKARQWVDPAAEGTQTNAIRNVGEVYSPDTAELADGKPNSGEAIVELGALTDMTVTKVPNPQISAAAGEPIEYTLTAKNAGPSAARRVKLEDVLPVGAIWVQLPAFSDNGGSCRLTDGGSSAKAIVVGELIDATYTHLVCAWNDSVAFGLNDQRYVTYQLRSVTKDAPSQLDNAVHVSTATPETNDANNDASARVTLDAPQVDVLINMKHTHDGIPLDTGATQYTITVTNNAASTSYATGVRMTEQFAQPDSTATFEFISLDGITSSQAGHVMDLSACTTVPAAGATTGPLVCDFPWLAPGESVQIKFTMKPKELKDGRPVGTIYHAASVSADVEQLPALDVNANNQTTDRTSTYDPAQVSDPSEIRYIDLSVTKDASYPAEGVLVGDEIAYTLTVKNEEDPAQVPALDLVNGHAMLTDELPEGIELVGNEPAGCNYAAATRELSCEIANLKAGESVDFSFRVKVTALADGQTLVANTAVVSNLGDPKDPNNQSRKDVPVASVDLSLAKSVDKSEARATDPLVYTLVVTNHGPSASKAGEIIDTLPAGVNFVSSPDCTAVGNTVNCAVGPLAMDATQSFTIMAEVGYTVEGPLSLVNTATVSTPGDTNPGNNTGSATTKVPKSDDNGNSGKVPPDGNLTPVPALGPLGLILLGLATFVVGGTSMRRRRG